MEIQTAHEAAIDLIRGYAERGDDVEHFKLGGLGCYCSSYHACVGGYIDGKKYPNTKIIVSKLNDTEVEEVFSLYQIWEEVLHKVIQPTLL